MHRCDGGAVSGDSGDSGGSSNGSGVSRTLDFILML